MDTDTGINLAALVIFVLLVFTAYLSFRFFKK